MNQELNLEMLKEDVIERLKGLLSEVENMDYDSLRKTAVEIGILNESIDGINIVLNYSVDSISGLFPDGTPKTILQDCLESVKQDLFTSADYDINDMLIILKESMYSDVFLPQIIKAIQEQLGYSLNTIFEKIAWLPYNDSFTCILKTVDESKEAINLLVKLGTDNEYLVWSISEELANIEEIDEYYLKKILSDINTNKIGKVYLN